MLSQDDTIAPRYPISGRYYPASGKLQETTQLPGMPMLLHTHPVPYTLCSIHLVYRTHPVPYTPCTVHTLYRTPSVLSQMNGNNVPGLRSRRSQAQGLRSQVSGPRSQRSHGLMVSMKQVSKVKMKQVSWSLGLRFQSTDFRL